jgi:nitrogen fixation protein FixH
MENQQRAIKTPAWKSPWVIGWVASIFIVLAANLVMVYLAIRTNPGLVVEDYYERGQNYEKTLFSRRANDPGWHMSVDLPEDAVAGSEIPVSFSVLDRAGVPVTPDQVTFFAYRPSDSRRDFAVPMQEETRGLYTAKVMFRLKGVWDILVSARQGGEEYNLGRRIEVAAPY